ncbi:MAG: phosphoglucosamine mutase [Lentisphaerae bacterium GWF2_52_8]|nr:MAG: phosphoglucosamine mutase [Lentisphaerae bacterium GWF2_52_8]
MRELFGTDGIRGKANTYPITPEIALQVGKALAHIFGAQGRGSLKALIGKDTRLSGYMIETALTSGLVSMGMDVLELGPMPTPAIAHLTRSMGAACGIMITASHNPSDDNGIKIFGSDGFKLPDAVEEDIEQHVFGGEITSAHINSQMIGKAYRIDDARGRYIEFAKSSIRNRSIKGLKVVLDCANGAAYHVAPLIFRELGAEVIKVAAEPDGYNINHECGATYTKTVSELVRQHGAHVGISLDGDADRVIFCDSNGQVVNGDRIIGLCALDFKTKGRLAENSIVVTSMSNLGLHNAMKEAGIKTEITGVGDRYVIERMLEKGYNVGGEQSGHVIFMDYATTGDGIITALHVLKVMIERQKPLSELASFMEEFPQKLCNIDVREKIPLDQLPSIRNLIAEGEKILGNSGRIMVRYSGTENKIRILVEAQKEEDVEKWTTSIADAVKKELC